VFKLKQATSKLAETNVFFPGYWEDGIEGKVFLTEKDAEMYLINQLRNHHKTFYIIEYVDKV
jgi:hypothetical protein